MLEWLLFGIAAILIICGLITVGIAVFGVYRFNFVINRMHIAAACDTLGIMLILMGLLILNGFNAIGLKLCLIIAFMWLANPVSSHLICKLEIETNENIKEECEVIEE